MYDKLSYDMIGLVSICNLPCQDAVDNLYLRSYYLL